MTDRHIDPPAASTGDRFVFFWGGFLSQWQRCVMEVDGVAYNCAEQYMMHQKALLFGDTEMARRIMATDDPREQKMMGQRVGGFDNAVWGREREGIVFRGNYAKFAQNAGLRKKLLKTAGKTLAEASPQDTNWGIGLAEDDPDVTDPRKWRGQNLLGKALMAVRDRLERETSD